MNKEIYGIHNFISQDDQENTPNVKIIKEKVTDYRYPEELSEHKQKFKHHSEAHSLDKRMEKFHTAQAILNRQLVQKQLYREKMLYSDPLDFHQDEEKIRMAEEAKLAEQEAPPQILEQPSQVDIQNKEEPVKELYDKFQQIEIENIADDPDISQQEKT